MKEPLIILQTEDKPFVIMDSENGVFEIGGKSLPDDANEFFAPVIEWISEYVQDPNKITNLIFKIDYFSSSSARKFFEIFKMLEKLQETVYEIKITWYYEPGDILMENKGLEFKTVLKLPFELIPSKEHSK